VVDLGYRLLGGLVGARRVLVAVTALAAAVGWLAVVRAAVTEPTPERALAMVAIPALLAAAAWSLFQLPPGVLFRPTVAPTDPEPQRTARCRASAYFEGTRRAEWRLLARSSLAIGRDGSLALVSPPPILAAMEDARLAFPSRGQPTSAQLRDGEYPRHPEWAYQPQALVGGPSRLVYHSAAEYAESMGKLDIPRGVLVDVVPGWQYAGFGRWPAIRVQYRGVDGTLTAAYLAFPDPGQRAWALAGLVGRGVAR
jgi:hypothetical protein